MAVDKPQYPPQGGEGRICCTLFLAMLLSVLSVVTMIYATVIIYLPSLKVLESKLQGPKTCTTQKTEMKLNGLDTCQVGKKP